MKRLASTLLLSLAVACSGSSGGGKQAEQPAGGGQGGGGAGAGGPAQSEQQLHAAQESAIEAMCERLVTCSVEDAKKTMTPEQIQKLDLPHLVPRARAQCEEDYSEHALSPRQVRVIQGCVNQQGTCAQLNDCLDAAKKKPGAAAPGEGAAPGSVAVAVAVGGAFAAGSATVLRGTPAPRELGGYFFSITPQPTRGPAAPEGWLLRSSALPCTTTAWPTTE